MYIISPVQGLLDYNLPKVVQEPQQNNHTGDRSSTSSMSGGGNVMEGLKALTHPALWPNIKQHVSTSLTVIKNLTDFAQELSQMYEHHAEELQLLVGNYRKKNTELRKERGSSSSCMVQVWEALLQEVEADSQAHQEVASVLGRQLCRHTLERTFHRKLQARKVLAHRESFDALITKTEESLSKLRQEYRTAYSAHLASPNSSASLSAYLDAHNTYVTQLHATNAMVETYSKELLPDLLQELEEVYCDVCNTMSESVAQGAEIISNRSGAQSRRYCNVWSDCKTMDPMSDTMAFVRGLTVPPQPHPSHRLRLFTPPHHESDPQDVQVIQLKNELVVDRLATLQVTPKYESLCEEGTGLETEIQHLTDALTTMLRIQQRSLESSLFNKANEIQEDISVKRYELKTAQLSLAAIRAQKELFAGKIESGNGGGGVEADRKMSSASTASMKSKWLKAFKSLKTPPPNNPKEQEKKNQMYHAVSTIIAMRRNGKELNLGSSESAHQFQEYTYKKITPCDVCSQVLRGHTRQGLKCRLCKLNVHIDCQDRVGKCQTKSRLLRRQKSSSEIETTSRGAGGGGGGGGGSTGGGTTPQANDEQDNPQAHSTRRRRLFQMRSFGMFGPKNNDRAASLPETEQVQYAAGTRPFGQPLVLAGGSSSPPHTPSPGSPKKHGASTS